MQSFLVGISQSTLPARPHPAGNTHDEARAIALQHSHSAEELKTNCHSPHDISPAVEKLTREAVERKGLQLRRKAELLPRVQVSAGGRRGHTTEALLMLMTNSEGLL
jgi:hypothetical protein